MDYSRIIDARDLIELAQRTSAAEIFPDLINRLVRGSPCVPTECRIPTRINQPGWDGKVIADPGYAHFVPTGTSYWEISTGSHPGTKARENIKNARRILGRMKERTRLLYLSAHSTGMLEAKRNSNMSSLPTDGGTFSS